MAKLEEKLIQLGYDWVGNTLSNCPRYSKGITLNKKQFDLCIVTSKEKTKIYFNAVYTEYYTFETQQDIDNLQLAYNRLQLDLEVLKDEEH